MTKTRRVPFEALSCILALSGLVPRAHASPAAAPATRPTGELAFEKKLEGNRKIVVRREVLEVNDPPKEPIYHPPANGQGPVTIEFPPSRIDRFSVELEEGTISKRLWAFDWSYANVLPGMLSPGKILDLNVEDDRAYLVFSQSGHTRLWIAKMTGPLAEPLAKSPFCELARSTGLYPVTVHSCSIQGKAKDGTMTITIDKEPLGGERESTSFLLKWRDDKLQLVRIPATQPATSRKADDRK